MLGGSLHISNTPLPSASSAGHKAISSQSGTPLALQSDWAPDGPFDVAVLRNVLQVLAPDAAARVVRNVGAALEPGGWLYVVGFVRDDDHLAPLAAAAVNMVFLNFYDQGRAHTEAEHRGWLQAAGFASFERIQLARGYSAIAARKGG